MGDEITLKKLSKILSILLMVALLVTINFDVYAKSRSGGFKSSSSHSSSSSSSSSKSSSSSGSGSFKSSSSYSKPSISTTKPSTSTNKSTSTSDVNKSSNNSGVKTPVIVSNNNYNSRSFMPMILYGNSFSSIILRYAGLVVIIVILFFVYKFIKRKH